MKRKYSKKLDAVRKRRYRRRLKQRAKARGTDDTAAAAWFVAGALASLFVIAFAVHEMERR